MTYRSLTRVKAIVLVLGVLVVSCLSHPTTTPLSKNDRDDEETIDDDDDTVGDSGDSTSLELALKTVLEMEDGPEQLEDFLNNRHKAGRKKSFQAFVASQLEKAGSVSTDEDESDDVDSQSAKDTPLVELPKDATEMESLAKQIGQQVRKLLHEATAGQDADAKSKKGPKVIKISLKDLLAQQNSPYLDTDLRRVKRGAPAPTKPEQAAYEEGLELLLDVSERDALEERLWLREQSESNITRALEALKQSAYAGHDGAALLLGLVYLDAPAIVTKYGSIPRDVPRAVAWLEASAAQGNRHAHGMLGFLYGAGHGVAEASPALSLLHYSFAAHDGYEPAQLAMGYRFLQGIGVPASCNRAAQSYHAVSTRIVTRMQVDGTYPQHERIRVALDGDRGSPERESDIVSYYRLAAQNGDPQAMVTLGQLHFHGGHGVDQDLGQARELFERAAGDHDDPNANAILGHMHAHGYGVDVNNKTALEYYQKGAAKNNPSAQVGLGLLYMDGQGVKQDYPRAIQYFKRAADQGNPEGQINLGVLHENGLGTRQSHSKALHYFQLAAQQGHPVALFHLGEMHHHGLGTPENCQAAVGLYKRVAELGAIGSSAVDVAHDLLEDNDPEGALLLYEEAAEQGYEVAQHNAGYLYDQGTGTDNLLTKASRTPLDLDLPPAPAVMVDASRQGALDQAEPASPSPATDSEKGVEASVDSEARPREGGEESEAITAGQGHSTQEAGDVEEEDEDEDVMDNGLFGLSESPAHREKRYARALHYYRLSARQSNVAVTLRLGDMHYFGLGTSENKERAAVFYNDAAKKNSAQAMFNLGYLHQFGIHLPQDFHLAKRYYDMAAAAPNSPSKMPSYIALLALGAQFVWSRPNEVMPLVAPYLPASIQRIFLWGGFLDHIYPPVGTAVGTIPSPSPSPSTAAQSAKEDEAGSKTDASPASDQPESHGAFDLSDLGGLDDLLTLVVAFTALLGVFLALALIRAARARRLQMVAGAPGAFHLHQE